MRYTTSSYKHICFFSAPPEINYDNIKEFFNLKEGDSTVIEVPFTASPQPKVRWTLNKNPIEISDRIKVDSINNMTSLSLGHAKLKDAGNYRLSLDNPHGSVHLDIKVKVIGTVLIVISIQQSQKLPVYLFLQANQVHLVILR